MTIDINEAICVYLDADQNGGFNPIRYGAERLKHFYGENHHHLEEEIAKYLSSSRNHPPADYPVDDPNGEGEFLRARLRADFPELSERAVRAISNYWTYSLR